MTFNRITIYATAFRNRWLRTYYVITKFLIKKLRTFSHPFSSFNWISSYYFPLQLNSKHWPRSAAFFQAHASDDDRQVLKPIFPATNMRRSQAWNHFLWSYYLWNETLGWAGPNCHMSWWEFWADVKIARIFSFRRVGNPWWRIIIIDGDEPANDDTRRSNSPERIIVWLFHMPQIALLMLTLHTLMIKVYASGFEISRTMSNFERNKSNLKQN